MKLSDTKIAEIRKAVEWCECTDCVRARDLLSHIDAITAERDEWIYWADTHAQRASATSQEKKT